MFSLHFPPLPHTADTSAHRSVVRSFFMILPLTFYTFCFLYYLFDTHSNTQRMEHLPTKEDKSHLASPQDMEAPTNRPHGRSEYLHHVTTRQTIQQYT